MNGVAGVRKDKRTVDGKEGEGGGRRKGRMGG